MLYKASISYEAAINDEREGCEWRCAWHNERNWRRHQKIEAASLIKLISRESKNRIGQFIFLRERGILISLTQWGNLVLTLGKRIVNIEIKARGWSLAHEGDGDWIIKKSRVGEKRKRIEGIAREGEATRHSKRNRTQKEKRSRRKREIRKAIEGIRRKNKKRTRG